MLVNHIIGSVYNVNYISPPGTESLFHPIVALDQLPNISRHFRTRLTLYTDRVLHPRDSNHP